MRTLLKLLVIVPLALLATAFAFANRSIVTVSFDPFAADVPAFALVAPLFVVILVTVATGVVLGGVASWVGQGRHRRSLREARRENRSLRADVARLKADLATSASAHRDSAALPAPFDRNAA